MAGILNVLSLPFVIALYAADALGNVVAHRSEFQADRRVVRMGYGRNLSRALRRVISLGGGQRPIGWRARLAAHASARPSPAWPASTPCSAIPLAEHGQDPAALHRARARPVRVAYDVRHLAARSAIRSAGATPRSRPRRPPLT